MKILVIGSGGREHALVKACRKSPLATEVLAAPGNGGIAADARCLPVAVEKPAEIVELAQREAVEFVLIGPELPLAAGVVDRLQESNILAFGPTAAGARLEASKRLTKDFLQRHNIPTAAAKSFTDYSEALRYLHEQPLPVVVKASGLAAGKGVVVCNTAENAEFAVHDMLVKNRFGESGHEVVIEEFMPGEEASIMLLVSGEDYVMLPPSQDHKRVGEGDIGLNTGGMGAYAPAAVVTAKVENRIRRDIIAPTLAGLQQDGIDYRGVLYIGIMIADGAPRVVEFNVRFGDPECQILLPLLQSDPLKLMLDCARGELKPAETQFRRGHALTVVMAAGGYPGAYAKGRAIRFPEEIPEGGDILHAGTTRNEDGQIVTSGGRVLNIVGTGPDLPAAAKVAYEICEKITWDGAFYRRDIGWRDLQRYEN